MVLDEKSGDHQSYIKIQRKTILSILYLLFEVNTVSIMILGHIIQNYICLYLCAVSSLCSQTLCFFVITY